jgi:hypothetical protein
MCPFCALNVPLTHPSRVLQGELYAGEQAAAARRGHAQGGERRRRQNRGELLGEVVGPGDVLSFSHNTFRHTVPGARAARLPLYLLM